MKKNIKKIIFVVNAFLLFVFIVVWIFELYKAKNHDSILFSTDRIHEENEISLTSGYVILLLESVFVLSMGIKRRFFHAEIFSLFTFSIVVLTILRESIGPYILYKNYESFIWVECFLLYYAIISFVISLTSGILAVFKLLEV